jgi:hypothetical protein
MSLRRVLLLTGLALFAAALVRAHVRLVHPTTKAPLYWSSPSSVGIVVGEAGSDDLPDGSHTTALRNAIDEWNSIEGTTLRLVEDASEEARARTDWSSHSIHLVLFDEDNDSGYFPPRPSRSRRSGSTATAASPTPTCSSTAAASASRPAASRAATTCRTWPCTSSATCSASTTPAGPAARCSPTWTRP